MKEFTKYIVCAGCGKQLSGVEFTEINGKPVCNDCEPVDVPTEGIPEYLEKHHSW